MAGFKRTDESSKDDNTVPNVNPTAQGNEQTPTYQPLNEEPSMSNENNNVNTAPQNDVDMMSELFGVGEGMATFSSSKATEDLTQLAEFVRAKLKSNPRTDLKIELIGDTDEMAAPAMLTYREVKGKIYFFTTIFAGYADDTRLRDLEERVNGQQIIVDMPPSKIYNDTFIQYARDYIAIATSTPRGSIFPTDYNVVDSTVDLSDEKQMRTHALLSLQTAQSAIQNYIAPFNAPAGKALASPNIDVTMTHEINPTRTAKTKDGKLLAADVIIDLQAEPAQQKRNGNNYDANTRAKAIPLSRAYVKLDVYKSPKAQQMMGASGFQGYNAQQGPQPGYGQLLILTGVEGSRLDNSNNRESFHSTACGLISLIQMAAGRNTMSLLDVSDKKHPRHAGLFGYDWEPFHNLGKAIEPRLLKIEKTMTPSQKADYNFDEFVNLFFTGELNICMDVIDGSSMAWHQRPYLQAAKGDNEANKFILDTFDRILNGCFRKEVAKLGAGDNPNVFQVGTSTILHDGVFDDGAGNQHSLVEVDYFYLMSKLKETSIDPQYGAAVFSGSLAPNQTSAEVLHKRRTDIIQLEPSAKVTGIIRRLYLSPWLMPVLGAAAANANLHINSTGLYDQKANPAQAWGGLPTGTTVDMSYGQAIFQPQGANGFGGFNHGWGVPVTAPKNPWG